MLYAWANVQDRCDDLSGRLFHCIYFERGKDLKEFQLEKNFDMETELRN